MIIIYIVMWTRRAEPGLAVAPRAAPRRRWCTAVTVGYKYSSVSDDPECGECAIHAGPWSESAGRSRRARRPRRAAHRELAVALPWTCTPYCMGHG